MPPETVRNEQPLLPPPVRRPAAVLAVVCGVVFVVLAVVFQHQHETYSGVDQWVYDVLQGPDVSYRFLTRLVDLVPPTFTLAVPVLAAATAALRKWRLAALAVLGPGLTMLVAEGGKFVVGRTIDGYLAMPSGHTAGVTTVSLVVAFLVVDLARGHALRTAALALAGVTVMAALIGMFMTVLGFHYATDTIGGYCAATAVTLGTAFGIDGAFRRWGRAAHTRCPLPGPAVGSQREDPAG